MPTKHAASATDLQTQVGAAIRRQRKAAGLSLRDLETATGIGRGHLSNFENGKINITLDTIFKLATAINCSPKSFFL